MSHLFYWDEMLKIMCLVIKCARCVLGWSLVTVDQASGDKVSKRKMSGYEKSQYQIIRNHLQVNGNNT